VITVYSPWQLAAIHIIIIIVISSSSSTNTTHQQPLGTLQHPERE
jgi:hypothetical protein